MITANIYEIGMLLLNLLTRILQIMKYEKGNRTPIKL